jgi:hypothetical protein
MAEDAPGASLQPSAPVVYMTRPTAMCPGRLHRDVEVDGAADCSVPAPQAKEAAKRGTMMLRACAKSPASLRYSRMK